MTIPHMQREIAEIPELLRTRAATIQDAADRARMIARGRRQWVTVGRGSSGHATTFAQYLITRASGRAPIDLRPAALRDIPPGTYDDAVVAAFSASGQSTDVAAAAAALKTAGAKVIAVANTNGGPSRLGDLADAMVDVGVGAEKAVPATKSFTAQLFAAAALAGHDAASQADAIASSVENIADSSVEAVRAFAAPARRIVWLARGATLAAAEDATLKIAETARRPAATWSAAEVLHGPVPAIGPDDRVIVMADGEDIAESVTAAIDGLRATGAPIAVLAQRGLGVGAPDLMVPLDLPVERWARALPLAVFGQRVALALALSAGLDPDAPPGLNKVTLTL